MRLRPGILIVVAVLFTTLAHAQDVSFPQLRAAARTSKAGIISGELKQDLLKEVSTERNRWSEEVERVRGRLLQIHSEGVAEALSRLSQADAEVQGRMDLLACALQKGTLPSNLLDDILGPEEIGAGNWSPISGSSEGLAPLQRDVEPLRPKEVAAAPDEYNHPPDGFLATAAATDNDPIATKAAELNHEPVALYRFVLNEIRSEHYFGGMKTAERVLASGSGNDADQALLLKELFIASGFYARLVHGVEELPVSALLNHFQVSSIPSLERLLTRSGIPWAPVVQGGHPVAYRLERVWCEAWLPFTNFRGVILDQNGATWTPLDPEWKTMRPRATRRVLSEMGFESQTFLQSYLSGNMCNGDPADAASCPSARDALASQVDAFLQAQGSTDTFASLGSSRSIDAQNENLLPSTLPGRIVSINGVYLTLPDSLQHRLRLQARSGGAVVMDTTLPVSTLSGMEAVLWFAPATSADQALVDAYQGDLYAVPPYLLNVTPQILALGDEVARGTGGIGMGSAFDLSYTLMTPSGDEVAFTNRALAGVPVALGIGAGKQAYSMPGAEAGNTLEILSKLANDYMDSKAQFEEELAAIAGLTAVHRYPSITGISGEVEAVQELGLVRRLEWKGAAVDADLWGAQADGGDAASAKTWMALASLNASTLERKIFEAYGVASASADKVFMLALQQSIPIAHIDASNIQTVLPSLPYGDAIKGEIQSWIQAGGVADIPELPITYIHWTGVGYILTVPATGEAKYQLAGGLSGGITVVDSLDVLNAISRFLAQFSSETINQNPDEAVRLEAAGFIYGTPIQTVDTVLPFPLKVLALDAQGRRVATRQITFAINGDAKFVDEDGDHLNTITVFTGPFGEASVQVKVGTKTQDTANNVHSSYMKLNDADEYDTQLGLYKIDITSGNLTAAPVWILASPDAPASLQVSHYPNAQPPLTVLSALRTRVADQFGNPIANAKVRHVWTSTLPGTLAPGFLTLPFVNSYTLNHPWPTTDEAQADLAAELEVRSDTLGDAYCHPSLGDGVVPGEAAASTIQVSVGSLSSTETVLVAGIPTFTAQVEPRYKYFGESVEAYVVGEPIQGDARVTVRQVEISIPDHVATAHYIRDATVVFLFYGDQTFTVQGTQGDSYSVPYPIPSNPGEYSYFAQVHTPSGPTIPVEGEKVWVIGASVSQAGDSSPLLVPEGGSNCSPQPVTSLIEPAAYVERTNPLVTGKVLAQFSLQVADPNDSGWVHSLPVGPAGQGHLTGQIDSGLLASNRASVDVDLVLNRPWTPGAPGRVLDTRKIDVSGVSLRIEPQLPSACVLEGSASPFDILLRTDSAAVVNLDDWSASLQVMDAANPGAGSIAISLSESGSDRVGSVSAESAQQIASMVDPVLVSQAQLTTGGCALPVEPIHLRNPNQPPLHVRIRNVYLRDVHRSCPGSQEIPDIVLPGLPQGETWTVTLDGIPVPDPDGNMQWQPGVYKTPYPQNVGSGSFAVDATSECPGGQATLHWDGDVVVEGSPLGGLPIGHPIVKGVDLATGAFHLSRQDLERPGLGGGLSIVRSFANTASVGEQGLGNNWGFNYEVSLRYLPGCQAIIASDINGAPYEFDAAVSPPSAFPGYHGRLDATTSGYLLTTKEGTKYEFEQVPTSSEGELKYLLQSITDPFGNAIQVGWQQMTSQNDEFAYRVQSVTDSAGRSLNFVYEQQKTIITGPDGERLVYGKDERGFLLSAKRYQGETLLWTESYTYKGIEDAAYGSLDTFTDRDGRMMKVQYFGVLADSDYQPAPAGSQSTVAITPQHRHAKDLWEGLDPLKSIEGQEPLQSTNFSYDMSTLDQSPAVMRATITNGKNETTTYTMGEEGESLAVSVDALNQITRTEWDLESFVKTKEIDPLGRESSYLYNSGGDQTDVTIMKSDAYPLTDGQGNPITEVTTHRDFDPVWHRVTLETTPDGVRTTYVIDPVNGSVSNKTETGVNATGGEISRQEVFTYNSQGSPLTDQNFEEKTTTYSQYDALGNAWRVDLPLSHFIQRAFDARGRKRTEETSEGRREVWEYNDLDQPVEHTVTDLRGATDLFHETWRHTAEGLLLEHSDNTGFAETLVYDLLGRKTGQTITTGRILPDGQAEQYITAWTYDAAGRMETRTDPDGSVHTFHHDEAGRILSESIGAKTLYSQEYDAAGNVRFRTDHRGVTTEIQYDALYRKIKEISPPVECANPDGTHPVCSPQKVWLYDRAGRVTKETDANGNDRVLAYDHFKRVGEEHLPFGHTVMRTYDRMDRLKTEEAQPQALLTARDYDDLGRVTLEERTLMQQSVAYTTTYAYDDSAQSVTVTNAAGEEQRVDYDGLGHVKSVTLDPGGLNLIHSYLYDARGKSRSEADANGNTSTYRNDGLGRRYEGVSPLLNTEDEQGNPSQRRAVVSRQYDFAGRVLVETDAGGASVAHSYDPLGRELTRAFSFGGASEPLASWEYHDSASLDPPDRTGPSDPSVTETDGRGNHILHWMDAMGREVMTQDQENHVTTLRYDRNSNLAGKIDRRGFEQRSLYDALNRRTENRWVGGATGTGSDLVETTAYDDPAHTVTTIDRMGYFHVQVTDEAGRNTEERVEKRDSNGGVIQSITTRRQYDGLDRVIDQFDGNNNQTHYGFDAAGRNDHRIEAFGTDDANDIHYVFDRMDHVKQIEDCEGLLGTQDYDAGYRLLTETDPLGNATRYGWDLTGSRVSMTDGEGGKTRYGYDPRRRLVRVTEPESNVTQYGYDGNDNRTFMLNGKLHRTEWEYDGANRVTGQKRFANGQPQQVTQTIYDEEGNRVGMIDPAQRSFTYEIDALGRETKAFYPSDGSSPDQTVLRIERDFDDLDRPTLIRQIRKSGQGETTESRTLNWDFAGRQTSETDAHGVSQSYTYDDNGNRLSAAIEIPQQSARSIGYSYDVRNRLKTVVDEGTTTYNYACRGEKLDNVQRADGSLETYAYDLADRQTSKTVVDGMGQPVVAYGYGYDHADRRTSQTEDHGQGAETTTYTYYQNSALKTAGYPDGKVTEYEYDGAGNRTYEKTTSGGQAQSERTYSYNDLEELTDITDAVTGDTAGFGYDANGNQTSKAETTGGATRVTGMDYTSRNHLREVRVDGAPVALFAYDDAGRRIQKNAEVEHWDGHTLIAETDAGSGVLLRDYTHGLDLLRETVMGQSAQAYTDILGSIGALRTGNDSVHFRYDAFGTFRNPPNCTDSPLSCDNRLTYTGHLFDVESELYYFNARYYDSTTGLFTATDPSVDLSKYRDWFATGAAGMIEAGVQRVPSLVVGQHATDWSVMKTENGLEPAFASLQTGVNPMAASDPFLAAANIADWSLSSAKDNAVPQLTFELRPQYMPVDSTAGYPAADPSQPASWYPYAYAFNSPTNYSDPLGTAVGDWWDPRSYADAKFFKDTGHSLWNVASLGTLERVESQANLGTIEGFYESNFQAVRSVSNAASFGLQESIYETQMKQGTGLKSIGMGISKAAYDLTPMEEIRAISQEGDRLDTAQKIELVMTGVSKTAGLLAGAKSFGEAGLVKYYEANTTAAYREMVGRLEARGMPDAPAGTYADKVVKRWAQRTMSEFNQQFGLRRNYPGGKMGAEPDALLPDYGEGFEFKRTVKSLRPKQSQAFKDLFSDYNINYVFGKPGYRPPTGIPAWQRAYLRSVISTAIDGTK